MINIQNTETYIIMIILYVCYDCSGLRVVLINLLSNFFSVWLSLHFLDISPPYLVKNVRHIKRTVHWPDPVRYNSLFDECLEWLWRDELNLYTNILTFIRYIDQVPNIKNQIFLSVFYEDYIVFVNSGEPLNKL